MFLKLKLILKQIRAHHWIKNLVIFLPIFFSGKLIEFDLLFKTGLMFLCFSMAASFVYCLNDLFDLSNDRLHPLKKNRPLAAGRLTRKQVIFLAILLLVLATIILLIIHSSTAYVLIISYLALNLAYTLGLKKLVLIDVFVLAINYLLRIYAGGVVSQIEISVWLFVTVLFGSFILIFGKRYSELKFNSTRKVMQYYTKGYLNSALVISITITIVAFVLYSITQGSGHIPHILVFTFVMLRYYLLVHTSQMAEQPELIFIKDRQLLIASILFTVFSSYVIYF